MAVFSRRCSQTLVCRSWGRREGTTQLVGIRLRTCRKERVVPALQCSEQNITELSICALLRRTKFSLCACVVSSGCRLRRPLLGQETQGASAVGLMFGIPHITIWSQPRGIASLERSGLALAYHT